MSTEEKRSGYITAVRIVKSELDQDGQRYEVTSPWVLKSLVTMLITALRINAAFSIHLNPEQIGAIQESAAQHQDEIMTQVRAYLDSEVARVMLDEFDAKD